MEDNPGRALRERIKTSLSNTQHGETHFRRQLTELTRLLQATRLLIEAEAESARGVGSEKADVAAFFIRRHLIPGYAPEADRDWSDRIDRILAADLERMSAVSAVHETSDHR